MASPPRSPLDAEAFQAAFPQLRAWILDEWPQLDHQALDETGGDAEAVVLLVATSTERTRVKTRRLLAELLEENLAEEPEPAPPRGNPPPRAAPAARPRARGSDPRDQEPRPLDPFERLVMSMEGHLDELAQQVKADVTPLAADTARKHLGLSLLLAGGIGLMLGLFLGAMGYGNGEEEPPPEDPDREGGSDQT